MDNKVLWETNCSHSVQEQIDALRNYLPDNAVSGHGENRFTCLFGILIIIAINCGSYFTLRKFSPDYSLIKMVGLNLFLLFLWWRLIKFFIKKGEALLTKDQEIHHYQLQLKSDGLYTNPDVFYKWEDIESYSVNQGWLFIQMKKFVASAKIEHLTAEELEELESILHEQTNLK